MRKALSSILVLILLLGMVIPASAAGTPTLSISSGEVKAGESVTLTVSIKDNPGIAGTMLYLYYDTDVFSIDLEEGVTAQGKFGSSGGIITNSINAAKETGRYDGEYSKDGTIVFWFSSTGTNNSTSGNIASVSLETAGNVANGKYPVEIGYSVKNTFNEDGETVELKVSRAIITVSGGKEKASTSDDDEFVAFTDVSGHWAESYIWQSAELGLVEGYEGLYRPNDTMTRAEFVTILWRAMGEPEPSQKASFTDLTQDWYMDAVAWAEENSVVNGMGDGLFVPNGSVTREQLVTILHRLAGNPMGMELMLSGAYDSQYSDSGQIGDWAKASLYWSIYEGIYCGENAEEIGSTLAPKSPANRAQIAVMMIRYLNEQQ